MKLQELSIGNWVYNKHHGKAIQITPFDFFTHTHRDGEQYLIRNPNLISGKDFEPIPITPEILEENGWVEMGESLYSCSYKDAEFGVQLLDMINMDDYWDLSINDLFVIEIKHIHQLQNALTLCGVDKEIKL